MASQPIEPDLALAAGGDEISPDKPFDGTSSEFDAQVFQWAWEKLEGWGNENNGKVDTWTFYERIEKAQHLTLFAVYDPLGTRLKGNKP